MRSGLVSRLRVAGDFVLARGLQFLAPILVANLLPRTSYGEVEFAHAWATLLAGLAGLGLSALLPLAIVRKESRLPLRTLLLHPLALGASLGGLALLALLGGQPTVALAVLLGAVLLMQTSLTYRLRSQGQASASLYLEAAPFSLIALAAGIATLLPALPPLTVIATALAMLAVGLGVHLLGLVVALPAAPVGSYGVCVRAGLPLMAAGFLSLLIATAGRIGAGLFGDESVTGEFAAIARIAALPVVVHQLLIVTAFRELYALPDLTLRRLLLGLTAAVGLSAAALWILLPWMAPWFGRAFADASAAHPQATRLLLAQVLLWSGVAMNDLLATRSSTMSAVLPWSMGAMLASLALCASLLLQTTVEVVHIASAQTAVMAAMYAAQVVVLRRQGVQQLRYWGVTAVTAAAMVVVSF